ncbi:hypothetical protein GCM10022409_37990 [Hymenobacter glaciei]|uniref:C-type lectin domain-containing protein n=1 Tax=Hymenobacter glaciei TaxID=877209 RepID=A0ABP7UN73_9BACT
MLFLFGLALTVPHRALAQAAPVFIYPPTPANGQVYSISQGQFLAFSVRAVDTNASEVLTLQAQGLPAGAAVSPATPASGNPVQTTFSWTPTAAAAGTYVITFTARDPQNLQASTSVTVRVTAQPCNPVANQPQAGPDQLTTSAGSSLTFTAAQLLANDTDPQGQPLQVASVGTPSAGTLQAIGSGSYTYTPQPGFSGTATFTYQVEPAGAVQTSEASGHYYEFVSAPGICWSAARTAAAARSYMGLAGYLATPTSPAEMALLTNRQTGQYWLGGSDDAVEGEWRWKTGPEAGQLFWQGAVNGTAVLYSNWSPGEPNNSLSSTRPNGEDYTVFFGASGLWNDASECNDGSTTAGYVVEYGGLEPCTPVRFATGTVSIAVGLATATSSATVPVAQLAALPNPSNGQLHVRVEPTLSGPARLELFDLQGRFVRQVFEGFLTAGLPVELPVDGRDLADGVYLLRLHSNQPTQVLRVVVQR